MTVLAAASARRWAPLAIAATALAIAGCGDSADLLPATDASKLDSALQRVADATDSGDCSAATTALGQAQNAFAELPAAVSPRLRSRISEGLQQLTDTVPTQCEQAAASPPEESPTTESTTSETTTTTETGPTGPTDDGGEEQPPTGPTGEENGGIAPQGNGPDGSGPPGQVKKQDEGEG